MTAPRRIVPNATYLFTRRCSERRFFLRPSRKTTDIFLYALALAAQRSGVRVHAFCVLSNHLHLVVTDPEARLPEFAQLLHALVARAVNASLGRWEALWAPGSYSAVTLAEPADVLDKSAYVLANPVAAGLVARGRDWPGAWSSPALVGGAPLRVKRPAEFFDEDGELPEMLELRLSRPPGYASAEDFRTALAAAAAAREREAARGGRRFLGVKAVLAQRPWERPSSVEPRREPVPLVACRDPELRKELLGLLGAFRLAYQAARHAFTGGACRTVFPFGTYGMRVFVGVLCQAAG